jgi:hypothetical protein
MVGGRSLYEVGETVVGINIKVISLENYTNDWKIDIQPQEVKFRLASDPDD